MLLLTGFLVVALPDNDVRLFSLSEAHGPSWQDAVGLLLIFSAELVLFGKVWQQRSRVVHTLGVTKLVAGTFLFSLGLALVIASVINNAGSWWVLGIVLMVLVQVWVFYIALK